MRTISDIAIFLRNGKSVAQSPESGGLPISRIETIADGRIDPTRVGFANLDLADCRDWLLEEGDILISHINSTKHLGKCAIYTGEPPALVHGMNLLALRVNQSRTTCRYAYHMLRSPGFRRQLPRITKDSVNQSSFNISNFMKLEIPLPPLPEQKRIAAILDAADALRAKRREALAQLDTLLQSTFLDMFGDPVTNPMGWEIASVGDEISFITSGSRGWASYYAESGDIFIRIQNLKRGRLDLEDIAFVAAPDSAEARRTRVEPGDVLLSITADLGRTAVVPDGLDKAHINQHLAILRFRELNPVFVSYQLASNGGQSQFDRLNREGVKAGLNFDDVKSIRVTKPPLPMQRRFSRAVEAIEEQKASQRAHLAELDTLFASLQSRAFRGEL